MLDAPSEGSPAFFGESSRFLSLLFFGGVSLTSLRPILPGWVRVGLPALVSSARAGGICEDHGPVVSVLDGNSFKVLCNNSSERIRIHGIDCPERGRAYGQRAEHAASALVFGKDKYGRTIPDVLLPDGTNITYTLVKDGWCWWYRKYAPGNTELEKLESEAREARKGLWADPKPVPPWGWRTRRRHQDLLFILTGQLEKERAARPTPS